MNLEKLFPEKTPPSGGWARLRVRLERDQARERSRRLRRRSLIGGLVTACLLAIWFILPPVEPETSYRDLFQDAGFGLTMLGIQEPDEHQPVLVNGPSQVLVPISADAEVVIYQLVRPISMSEPPRTEQ